MRAREVIVVGAGPAGCAAAVQCQRLGLSVRLLDRSGVAGGLIANAHLIENCPGMEPLDGPAFAGRLAEQLERFGLRVERACAMRVRRVDEGRATEDRYSVEIEKGRTAGERYSVEIDGGASLVGDCVIAATGTRPVPLEVPGAIELAGRGLFHEVRDLLARVPAAREVWIVGGGEAACDYALTLAAAGARVTLLARGEGLRACARLLAQVEAAPGIRVHLRVMPLAVRRVGGRIEVSLRGPEDDPLPAASGDAGLVAIGRRGTAADLLGPLAGTDPRALERAPGLFVAGDARWGGLGQVGIAAGDGLAAAQLAAGGWRSEGGQRGEQGEGGWRGEGGRDEVG